MQKKPLSELCELIVDCPHSTPKWTPSGVVVLRNQYIKNGRLDLSNPSYTDEYHYHQRVRRATPCDGDIVLTREAPMGEVCMIPKDLKCCLGQRMVLLRGKDGVVDKRYLFYALQSHEVKNQIGWSEGTGSVVSNLRIPLIESLQIPTPPLETQKEIAHILGTLDDKIELNRKMCKALEEIAQTLFKHWFIDFEFPNEQGKPYKSSGGEMVDSELGPIPKGWTVGLLSDEFIITMGQSPPGSTYNQTGEGLPFFQGNADFGFRFPVNRVFCSDPRRVARPGDTLVSVRAPIGDVNLANEICCIGRGLCSVRHKDGYHSYTYYLMKSVGSILKSQNDNGTVFGCLNKKSLDSYKLVRVPKVLLETYTHVVDGLSSVIKSTTKEIEAMGAISEVVMTSYFNLQPYV